MAAVRCGVPAGAQRVVALGAARCPNAQGSVVSEWMAAAARGAFAGLVQRLGARYGVPLDARLSLLLVGEARQVADSSSPSAPNVDVLQGAMLARPLLGALGA